jgi:uncharacterized protein
MRSVAIGVLGAIALVPAVTPASGAEAINILYLTKSVDFEHGPVAQKDGKASVSDAVLAELAKKLGATITCTKDASQINAAELEKYQLVMFYTQGDLTKAGGKDGAPGMSETGEAELIEWIKKGGGFIGFHSATDTLRTDTGEPTPYVQMIGAQFRTHGKQFEGHMKVVDPSHPSMAHFPAEWPLHDEWYLFKNFNRDAMHVLVTMDPGEERTEQDAYNIPAYPVTWCSALGKGRVYSTALAHREEIWEDPAYQQIVVDAMKWALGEGETEATPDFAKIVAEGDVDAIEGK